MEILQRQIGIFSINGNINEEVGVIKRRIAKRNGEVEARIPSSGISGASKEENIGLSSRNTKFDRTFVPRLARRLATGFASR